jgi:hypothetical protein
LQNEVESLRMKLQHVDTRSAHVDHLLAVIGTYKEKEVTGTVAIQLDSHAKKIICPSGMIMCLDNLTVI